MGRTRAGKDVIDGNPGNQNQNPNLDNDPNQTKGAAFAVFCADPAAELRAVYRGNPPAKVRRRLPE